MLRSRESARAGLRNLRIHEVSSENRFQDFQQLVLAQEVRATRPWRSSTVSHTHRHQSIPCYLHTLHFWSTWPPDDQSKSMLLAKCVSDLLSNNQVGCFQPLGSFISENQSIKTTNGHQEILKKCFNTGRKSERNRACKTSAFSPSSSWWARVRPQAMHQRW